MRFQLTARTPAGEKFVELAERHADEAAPGAAERDRTATFPAEIVDSMKSSGFIKAMVPEEFGGMGVSSVHDLVVAMNRLGRADASLAIAVNMHFTASHVAARLLRAARESGDATAAAGIEGYLAFLGGGAISLANATEASTDLRHPMLTATKVEGGWELTGRKIFGTLSPVADVMTVSCRVTAADGSHRAGMAVVFRGTAGQTIHDNWDALGMRASGSHDVSYDGCFVPDGMLMLRGAWGEESDMGLVISTAGNVGLLAVYLGVAEAARDHVARLLTTRTKQPTGHVLAARPGIQHGMAELEMAVATCRAHLDWVTRLIDDELGRPIADSTVDDLHHLNGAFQASKLVVNRAAIDAVDKAMQLTGGSGYLTADVLSRLYRDVRAGPFMQPFSPNEAYEYIGRVALGQPPGYCHGI